VKKEKVLTLVGTSLVVSVVTLIIVILVITLNGYTYYNMANSWELNSSAYLRDKYGITASGTMQPNEDEFRREVVEMTVFGYDYDQFKIYFNTKTKVYTDTYPAFTKNQAFRADAIPEMVQLFGKSARLISKIDKYTEQDIVAFSEDFDYMRVFKVLSDYKLGVEQGDTYTLKLIVANSSNIEQQLTDFQNWLVDNELKGNLEVYQYETDTILTLSYDTLTIPKLESNYTSTSNKIPKGLLATYKSEIVKTTITDTQTRLVKIN